jgi:hypothetical protein
MNKNQETPERKVIQTKEFVKYQFTHDEIHAMGADLARVATEHRNIDNERKAIASEFKAKLDGKSAEIEMISSHINSGFQHKYVDCKCVYNDPQPGFKTTYRHDSGEIVKTESMSPDELQVVIPFEDKEQN